MDTFGHRMWKDHTQQTHVFKQEAMTGTGRGGVWDRESSPTWGKGFDAAPGWDQRGCDKSLISNELGMRTGWIVPSGVG